MPEGDTVLRTARRLHAALAGMPLAICDLRWASIATVDLTGRATIEVIARGKHLLHRVEGGHTIHSHLRMDGSWRVVPLASLHGRPPRDHRIRAVVGTVTQLCLGRSLGRLDVVPTGREHELVGHLGPDLLADDWDPRTALAGLRAGADVTVGEAMLDQRRVAGVGTIHASESLFLRRLHPHMPVSELDDETGLGLLEQSRRSLIAGVQGRAGSAARGTDYWTYGRTGRSCRRCGAPVRTASVGPPGRERTLFVCPRCQVDSG